MRLDFNVLWVDDHISNVQSTRTNIERKIKKEGFRLQVKFASSIAEAIAHLSDDIYGDHVDLILMDYNLGAGGRGDVGLVEIRGIFKFKDIVFYSSEAENLEKMVADKKVQGVFCAARGEDLVDTAVGVFDALVKKVLDIDHSRGIIMGATSDIDECVKECIAAGFEISTTEQRENILNTVKRHVSEKQKFSVKELKKIAEIKHIAELNNFHQLYTSNDRFRLLNNFLGSDTTHEECLVAIAEYLQKVVPLRNKLAHVRVKIDGFSRKLYDDEGNELTNAQMKSLRQELLKYQDIFGALLGKLKPPFAIAR